MFLDKLKDAPLFVWNLSVKRSNSGVFRCLHEKNCTTSVTDNITNS